MKKRKNEIQKNCRFARVCVSTRKGAWLDCSRGKGYDCDTTREYCKPEPRKKLYIQHIQTKTEKEVNLFFVQVMVAALGIIGTLAVLYSLPILCRIDSKLLLLAAFTVLIFCLKYYAYKEKGGQ